MNFNPSHTNTSKHLKNGVLSTALIQGIKILCSFASVVVLSRLLPPSDFGVVAMVGPIVGFIGLFQDLGLSQATIQKQEINHDEVNAFFWINVALGLFLSLLVAGISPLVGWYYGDERVVALTIGMGALIFVGSLGGQHYALLSRRMEFGRSAFLDGLSTVGSLAVGVICALLLHNYWALYWSTVAGSVISLVGVWLSSGWRPTFPRKVAGIKSMLKFGAGMTITNFMGFVGTNIDNVLIGRRWGNQELGLYDRAFKLLLFPLQKVVWPLGGIMIPILSRLLGEPDRYREMYLKVLGQITMAAWPLCLWTIVYADQLIPTLLGEQWSGVVEIFRPMAMIGLLFVFSGGNGWLLISQGRTGDSARLSIWATCSGVIAFLLGLPYGAFGVSVASAVMAYTRVPFTWWYLYRRGPVRASDVVTSVFPQIIGCSFSVICMLFCHALMISISSWIALSVGLVVAYSSMLFALLFFSSGRRTLKQTFGFLIYLITSRSSEDGEYV